MVDKLKFFGCEGESVQLCLPFQPSRWCTSWWVDYLTTTHRCSRNFGGRNGGPRWLSLPRLVIHVAQKKKCLWRAPCHVCHVLPPLLSKFPSRSRQNLHVSYNNGLYIRSSLQIHLKSEPIYKKKSKYGFPTLTVFSGQFLPDPRFVNPRFCLGEVCKRCTEEKVGKPSEISTLTKAMFWTQGWRGRKIPKILGVSYCPLPNTQCMVYNGVYIYTPTFDWFLW